MGTNERTIIGSNIKMLRERFGYTQAELAKYLSVPRSTIIYMETGEKQYSFDQLERLSELLNVDLADLLEEDGNTRTLNCAFAFRTNELSPTDLDSFADFHLVVRNYMKMKNLMNGQNQI